MAIQERLLHTLHDGLALTAPHRTLGIVCPNLSLEAHLRHTRLLHSNFGPNRLVNRRTFPVIVNYACMSRLHISAVCSNTEDLRPAIAARVLEAMVNILEGLVNHSENIFFTWGGIFKVFQPPRESRIWVGGRKSRWRPFTML